MVVVWRVADNSIPSGRCFTTKLHYGLFLYHIIYSKPVCDRIENSGPDWDHFDRNRTGFQAKKMLNGFDRIGRIDRIFTGFLKL